MAIRSNTRWVGVVLLGLAGVSPILVRFYNAIFCGSCAVGLSYTVGLGISLGAIGILLPILGSRYRQHPQRFDLIQDCIFAIGFILVGMLLFFQGWRLDPALQFAQWVLIESIIYWVIKDIYS